MDHAQPRRFGWLWLLISARVAAALLAFLVAAPLHLLCAAIGQRALVPPRFLRLVAWLIGMRVKVEGRPARGKLLLLANHVSWMDILALAGAGKATFVARGNLSDHRLLGWLCRQNDTVMIAREKRSTVASQVAQIRHALTRRRLAIFPEGTTSDGKALLPFKSALLSAVEGLHGAQLRVQPVALQYHRPQDIAWHNGESGRDNVLRILARRRPVQLTVRFLHPLNGNELRDRKAMAEVARIAIARSLTL